VRREAHFGLRFFSEALFDALGCCEFGVPSPEQVKSLCGNTPRGGGTCLDLTRFALRGVFDAVLFVNTDGKLLNMKSNLIHPEKFSEQNVLFRVRSFFGFRYFANVSSWIMMKNFSI
tara:strand:+ start:62 stop:412 length:351 start_codon:yes stop_codon:yes gene_type:complete